MEQSQLACLFNLIIYTENEDRLPDLNKEADKITQKFPARVIVILGKPDTLKSETTVKEIASSNAPTTSWNRIFITAAGSELKEVSLLLLPYLIPDYPTYLLFSGNPSQENQIFTSLMRLTSRLIVDSESSNHLHDFCEKIVTQIDQWNIDVCDINWARTFGWRNILSEVFDSPLKISQLTNCKFMQISYNTQGPSSINQALYLQAWLASCLNWIFVNLTHLENSTQVKYKIDDKEIIINLIPKTHDHFTPGALLNIEVTTENAQIFTIIRKEDASQVIVHISSVDTCDLPYTLYLPNVHRSFSYLSQLLYSHTSSHYRNMLKMLTQECIPK